MFGEKGLYGTYDIKVNADGTTTMPKQFHIEPEDSLWFITGEDCIALITSQILDEIVKRQKEELRACKDMKERLQLERAYFHKLSSVLKQFEMNRSEKVKVADIFDEIFKTTENIIAVGAQDRVLFFTKEGFEKKKSLN